MRLRSWILLLVATVALPSAAGAHRESSPGTGLPNIRFAKAPPDFQLDADGMPTHLAALVGKPVVVNFWATWCEPCRDELSTFAKLRQAYGSDVVLVTVSNQDPELTVPILRDSGVGAVSVPDPQSKIFNAYSVTTLPVTLVLDRRGTVEHVSVGELDWDELRAAIDAALAPQ